jgi:hypothetical protein
MGGRRVMHHASQGTVMVLTVSGDRLRDRFDRFNQIGATERGGVNRPSLSDANREARDTLVEWFGDAGLDVHVDEMGNIFGRREGRDDLSPVLLGSHVDSQYNGGRFDGVIGVLDRSPERRRRVRRSGQWHMSTLDVGLLSVTPAHRRGGTPWTLYNV